MTLNLQTPPAACPSGAPATPGAGPALARLCLAGTLALAMLGQAHAAGVVYVPNSDSNSASVIDTSSQTQTALIPGMGNTYSAVIAPNGSLAYVADFYNNRIFPINTATHTAGPAIAVGSNPVNVTFSANSATAYVSNYSGDSISVIDVASATVASTVAGVCAGGQPVESVFQGTDLLLVCVGSPSAVRRMDTANGNALSTLATVGNSAYSIAISSASGFGYVANYGGGSVSKFDLTTGATTTYPTTGLANPIHVRVTPDGSQILVGDYSSNNLIFMNPNGGVSATLNLGAPIAGIGLSANGALAYVPLQGLAKGIKVIDIASRTVIATIANPGANPRLILGDFLGSVASSTPTSVEPVDPFPKLGAAPYIPGLVAQPTVLDMASGSGTGIAGCLLPTLQRLLGGELTYQGQSASGAVQLGWNAQRISLYPLAARIASGQSESIQLTSSNALNVVTTCGTLTTAPAIDNLNAFGAALRAMGLSAQFNAQGVATVQVNGASYVVRPDYVVTPGAPATPSLAFDANGVLRLTDSAGWSQVLHPAFLDTDGLAAQLGTTFGGWTVIQDNGQAVFHRLNGEQWLLTPDMTLSPVPADKSALFWWQDRADHFMFRSNGLSQVQGFTAKLR